MPQLRKDPLSDRWVILAEGREERPNEFERRGLRRSGLRCPFCAGNESDTPPAIVTYGPADGDHAGGDGPWSVRVVPNKYPALVPHGRTEPVRNGLYEQSDAVGGHEVIVESPRHVSSLSELTLEEASLLMRAYRDRLRVLRSETQYRYALIFKNVGPEAGASLEHAHSQLVATPMVPIEVQQELNGAQRLFTEHRQCFFCQVIAEETDPGPRRAALSPRFIAVCPFASRMPYELWVLPRQHASHFEDQSGAELAELAQFLQRIITKLESLHGNLAYNYFLHTAPLGSPPLEHYHWHLEVFPRLATTAGFEWGAGYFINPVPPEQAAAILRS
jgi:UDPglucose--hexose-1-phosphate uridylyltransferase